MGSVTVSATIVAPSTGNTFLSIPPTAGSITFTIPTSLGPITKVQVDLMNADGLITANPQLHMDFAHIDPSSSGFVGLAIFNISAAGGGHSKATTVIDGSSTGATVLNSLDPTVAFNGSTDITVLEAAILDWINARLGNTVTLPLLFAPTAVNDVSYPFTAQHDVTFYNDNNVLSTAADIKDGVLAAVWTDRGEMRVNTHRGPRKYIGSSASGWDSFQPRPARALITQGNLDSSASTPVDALGQTIIHGFSGWSYLGTIIYSKQFGIGARTQWLTGAAGISATAGYRTAYCRTPHMQIALARVTDPNVTTGTIAIYPHLKELTNGGIYLTNAGDTPVNLSCPNGVQAPGLGIVHDGTGYVVLYTDLTNQVRMQSSEDGATWGGEVGIVDSMGSGFSGQVGNLVCTAHNVLIATLHDWNGSTGSQKTSALISRDQGATWTKASDIIVTQLLYPPYVCEEGGTAYAVYVDPLSVLPMYVASEDGGVSWL